MLKCYPGILLALSVTLVSSILVWFEKTLFGFEALDGLVFAIILGTLVKTVVGVGPKMRDGVDFSAKYLLEIAVVLLGATVSVTTIADAGVRVVIIVVATVLSSLAISYGIGRVLGLSDRLATLVACGNSICGNSAIVAAAPVIGAKSDDVAASIAFTAALGILVVLLLPLLFSMLHLTEIQYGMFAGLTVYAVPQVLAATAPIGGLSVQMGTLVKLMRVLMLGPVVLVLRLKSGWSDRAQKPISITQLVPWFIVGFFIAMCLRSIGCFSPLAVETASQSSAILTTVSMAALGLSVNLRTVFSSGGRVLLAGVLSLTSLGLLGLVALAVVQP
ncbi:putative sulfate exporter family transporter [Rhizobium cauense]|uniref:YeiH family protein n=1 Tax=Rhizobium cauense TaxID=1166683 RepID=UPI00055DC2C4|nr:putative sulfate exporter family transporter [Rhizobium cauense]MBW9113995.1 putative sulfate exporter family transporter [Rhizobium cauense]